jgi:hypothetical protein
MWYAIAKLEPVKRRYSIQYAFVRSLRKGLLPTRRSNLKRSKVFREVKSVWYVMKLHSIKCRDFIEPYENKWMTEEEFRKAVENIVNECYKSKETRSRKLKMFEEWLRNTPEFGKAVITPEDEYVIKLSKSELHELVGNSCVQAYILYTNSPITAKILQRKMLNIYRGKNNRLAITEVVGDYVYAVFISVKCLESGVFEIPHLPRYGARVLWWYITNDYLPLAEKVDKRLAEFIRMFTGARKKVEVAEVGRELVERVVNLFKEYEELIGESRSRDLKPLLVPTPVINAIEDIANDARNGKVWTNNVDDLRKKLEKYIEILRRAVELNKEKILVKKLLE